MEDALKRVKACISHLEAINAFFNKEDPKFLEYSKRLEELGEPYSSFCKAMYHGDFDRQMQLSDLLTYMLISRGTIWVADSKRNSQEHVQKAESYIRILFYMINQILLEEHITYFPDLRQKFLDSLEKKKLDYYIEGVEYGENYKKAKESKDPLHHKQDKKVYKAIDRLLPKSLGTAVELVIYLYLLRHKIGYVIPLLLHQRLLGLDSHLIAPDFLVVTKGKVFGIEVEQSARTGKTRQSNEFMAETGIPVLTASVPTTFPLRCPECHRWILFCDNIISKYADIEHPITSNKILCDNCNEVVYLGRIQKGGEEYHYHLDCVKKYEYVKAILADPVKKSKHLVAYFPSVQGLDRLLNE